MPRPRNPLDEVFGEIDQLDRMYQMRRAMPRIPRVTPDLANLAPTDEQTFGNMGPVENDLERARLIADIGQEASRRKILGHTANIGQNVLVTDISTAPPTSPFGGKPVLILKAEGDETDGQTMTVVLAVNTPIQQGGPQSSEPENLVAVIQFGSGGAQSQAEVDFINGQVIQVPGSSIQVFARLDTKDGSSANQMQANVGAWLVKYPKARVSRLTRSLFVQAGGIAHGGSSQTFPIPPFATEFQLLYNPSDTLTNILYTVFDDTNTEIYRQPASVENGLLRLAGSASAVNVKNNDGAINLVSGYGVFTIEL